MKQITIWTVLVLSFGFNWAAQASTTGSFAGTYGMIRIMPKNSAGDADLDATTLYRGMNVPVKNSMLGPGKLIEDSKKALQFICAIRNGSGYECAIFIQKSDVSSLNPAKGIVQYKVTGEDADVFTKQFHVDVKGEFYFVSLEGNFKVDVRPHYFEVLFNRQSSLVDSTAPKTLVIADVEDTLKITHSQNFWDSLNYVDDTASRYYGMQEALSFIATQKPNTTFIYLTQPDELMAGRNQLEFLNKNHFPNGVTQSFRNGDSLQSRALELQTLVKNSGATQVILLGHNGGMDSELFSRLSAQLTKIDVLTYLHVVYSANSESELGKVLQPGQTGYVTSVELLMDLASHDVVNVMAAKALSTSLLPRILSETSVSTDVERAVPVFVNCENFVWKWEVAGPFDFTGSLKQYLAGRCHR